MTGVVWMLRSTSTRRELRATCRAVLLALAVELGVRTVRLDRIACRLGLRFADEDPPDARTSGPHPAADTRVRLALTPSERIDCRAVARIVRRWPGARGLCLREALLYGRALRAHSPRLHVGAATVGDRVLAHAWLSIHGGTLGHTRDVLELTSDGA